MTCHSRWGQRPRTAQGSFAGGLRALARGIGKRFEHLVRRSRVAKGTALRADLAHLVVELVRAHVFGNALPHDALLHELDIDAA